MQSGVHQDPQIETWLGQVPSRLAACRTDDEVSEALAPPDVDAVIEQQVLGGTVVTQFLLSPPVDARWLASAWGLPGAVVASPDVQQQSWQLMEVTGELEDAHGRRVSGRPPRAGLFELVVWMDGRPAGALPDVSLGASPAYDLLDRGGSVTQVEVHRVATADPDDDRPADTVEEAEAAAEEAPAAAVEGPDIPTQSGTRRAALYGALTLACIAAAVLGGLSTTMSPAGRTVSAVLFGIGAVTSGLAWRRTRGRGV